MDKPFGVLDRDNDPGAGIYRSHRTVTSALKYVCACVTVRERDREKDREKKLNQRSGWQNRALTLLTFLTSEFQNIKVTEIPNVSR